MVPLVLLFIVVPLAELYVIVRVGGTIGVLPTIGILLVDSLVGAALLRAQGSVAWRRFNQVLAEGRWPGREVADGALVLVGGTLLITPGFITDAVGLSLLLPPSRAAIRGGLARILGRRLQAGQRVFVWGAGRVPPSQRQPGRSGHPPGRPYDIDGTAHEGEEGPPAESGPAPPKPPLPPS
jgi:UPF0716 protein FxsA